MKKVIKIICIIIGIIIILGIIFFSIDNYRVSKEQTPIFCIKNPAGVINDGGTVEYFGLGYKVIDFNTLAGYDEIKIGTWFMKYEDFSSEMAKYESNFETDVTTNENSEYNYSKTIDNVTVKLNIPDGWNYEEIEENSNNDNSVFQTCFYKSSKENGAILFFDKMQLGVCGTGLERKEITLNNEKTAEVGYYDESEKWDFISFSASNSNRYIYFINNMLDNDESREALEFIKTINIEIKSVEKFELIFTERQPFESYNKISIILDKSETDKYDYNIYSYDGITKIKIDGEEYLLKDALLQNKITMDEIIEKANDDLKNNKITGDTYKDGGSLIYHYSDYTIIKCHTESGNRDVYIGTTEMNINDVL